MERVAAEASKSGDKVRVLVAEDNKVNQEVVLRMLKLEDIYGTLGEYNNYGPELTTTRRNCCEGWAGGF